MKEKKTIDEIIALGEKELKEITTYLPYLGEGDTVKVRIISAESREGYPVVSMRSFLSKFCKFS